MTAIFTVWCFISDQGARLQKYFAKYFLFPFMSAKDEKPRKSSSASKPKRDPQRQVLSKDQLEKVYDNLDSHKYTTLKWKAIFDTETTKFFKHVKRSTNLTALEIKGSGLAPKHAGDLCQLVDQSRKLICLRIKDHSLDGPSFSRTGEFYELFLDILLIFFRTRCMSKNPSSYCT